MGAAVQKAIRIIGLILRDMIQEDGSTILKTTIAVITLFLGLILLILIPVVIHERVPVTATKAQALWYYDAAQAVTMMTQSPCDPGVYVDWQEVIAVDAVRLKQNFKKSSASRANDLAMQFVEESGTCTH
ncbi:Uncharacterized [Syntrophomonas zehnderi OL-4]|uniref:Uncharacterized n=1 Tax=Syntrophomonas zehnderi OL-4 TaxID=690567 RepID=A0A0E4C7Z1_9FIRM|nr:hypothetical protein [Syntrophomonas zehnderi]CFX16326.1 Uncharacterized [Syntrophomonas zehnderi OL-4]